MTTYHISGTVAWNRLGQFVTTGRGVKSKAFYDPNTLTTPAGAKQNGVAITQITADPQTGAWSIDLDVLAAVIDFGAGPQLYMAQELPNAVLTAAAPTDAAIASAVNTGGSSTDSALRTLYPSKSFLGMELPTVLNDYAALQAAANNAATNGTRLVASGTISTSSTLTIKSDCELTGLTYNYTGTTVAVQVGAGTSGTILFRKDVNLPGNIVFTPKTGTGWSGSAIGVQASNTYGCSIRVPHVKGFVTGYYAYGLGTGNVYNDVLVLHMENNKRNLVLGAGTGGWSNSNTYRLGLLTHDSAEGSSVAGTRNILIETATNLVNANRFLGGSVEGNVSEYHVDCDGLYNRFEDLRWENAGGCRVIWQANSSRNIISYGYNAQNVVETHVTGSNLNRILTTSVSRLNGSTSKAVQVIENTSSSASAADAVMDPGATLAGSDPATAYRVYRSGDATKMKRATDSFDRMILDHVNGRLYLGDGTAAPTTYLQFDSSGLWKLIGASLYPNTNNANDLGINANRWRRVYTGQIFLSTASGGPSINSGTGSPEGVLTAPVGSLYTRTDGGANTTLYVKESGASSTGWIAK